MSKKHLYVITNSLVFEDKGKESPSPSRVKVFDFSSICGQETSQSSVVCIFLSPHYFILFNKNLN